MDSAEIGLKCLELAMTQAKNEGQHQNIERVAEIQTRFHNLITEAKRQPGTETEPEVARKRGRPAKPQQGP